MFPVVCGVEQAIDVSFVGLGIIATDKGIGDFRCGRQADQVQMESPNECVAIGCG